MQLRNFLLPVLLVWLCAGCAPVPEAAAVPPAQTQLPPAATAAAVSLPPEPTTVSPSSTPVPTPPRETATPFPGGGEVLTAAGVFFGDSFCVALPEGFVRRADTREGYVAFGAPSAEDAAVLAYLPPDTDDKTVKALAEGLYTEVYGEEGIFVWSEATEADFQGHSGLLCTGTVKGCSVYLYSVTEEKRQSVLVCFDRTGRNKRAFSGIPERWAFYK